MERKHVSTSALTGEKSETPFTAEENQKKDAEEAAYLASLKYSDKRRLEYPTIADQLDLIYWDSVNGTNNFTETIGQIKAKYPKVPDNG